MATLEEITAKFREAVGADSGLGRSVKFILKGDGVVRIDGGTVSNDDTPTDLTLTLTRADLEAIGEGRLNAMTAVMTGRLKVSDMTMALQTQSRLQALFERVG